jgi:Transport and Golgi organisation 2
VCTVSWFHTREGYELLCNRDERHTRRRAQAPALQRRQGVQFIAPIDGERGGSWIGVNQFGLTFCLLNRYDPQAVCAGQESQSLGRVKRRSLPSRSGSAGIPRSTRESYKSRGLLLMELLVARSPDQVQDCLRLSNLESFQPFTLVILEPACPSRLLHWNGQRCRLERNGDYAVPLTSSSFDPGGANFHRKVLFSRLAVERGRVDAELLRVFHASHAPAPGAYSPCMHRQEASTVSFSRIKVCGPRIEFFYCPGPPCSPEVSEPVMTRLTVAPTAVTISH